MRSMRLEARRLGSGRALVLAAGLAACSREDPGGGERYLSIFNARQRTWQRESELRVDPAKMPGMMVVEVSLHPPGSTPSEAQRRSADEFLARCARAAQEKGWYDFEKARADGYELVFEDRTHFANRAFLFDDTVLDPERPEILMYATSRKERRLVAFMFYARSAGEHGPQIGGPLTVWHYHTWPRRVCLERGLLPVGHPDERGLCVVGEPADRSPEMVHAWLIDHPEGRFATTMAIPRSLLKQLLHVEGVEPMDHEHHEHP